MDKIELTREQERALEVYKSYNENLETFTECKDSWSNTYQSLKELTLDEMARLLYQEDSYEIKEEFKLGEYIVYENDVVKNTMKIIAINKENITVEPIYEGFKNHNVVGINSPLIRHATPEEIAAEKEKRWWAKHNRKTWEIQEGDCLISKHDKSSCQVKFVEASDEVSVLLVDGIQDEFYEGEHDLKIMRDRYDVFCFAEDRKDE